MQVITKPLRLALHPTDDSAVCAVSKRTFDITYSDRNTAGLEISVIASYRRNWWTSEASPATDVEETGGRAHTAPGIICMDVSAGDTAGPH
ncbi:hypothetical protein WJX84_010586 [Apatococcus fuscideae]|uniref:Uncharacterized protein n=1 Tax=Apatococcus fuscideae TaxID=2026836 RepID=A0AAW1TH32_9CHLO